MTKGFLKKEINLAFRKYELIHKIIQILKKCRYYFLHKLKNIHYISQSDISSDFYPNYLNGFPMYIMYVIIYVVLNCFRYHDRFFMTKKMSVSCHFDVKAEEHTLDMDNQQKYSHLMILYSIHILYEYIV